MGQHRAAGLFTFQAFFRARHHHFVIFAVELAFLGAARAGVGTGLTHQIGEGAVPGHNMGRRRAHIGAIPARHQGRLMMVFALPHPLSAMRGAQVAFPLAIGTGPGTRLEGIDRSGRAGRSSLLGQPRHLQGCQGRRRQSGHCKFASMNHDLSSPAKRKREAPERLCLGQ